MDVLSSAGQCSQGSSRRPVAVVLALLLGLVAAVGSAVPASAVNSAHTAVVSADPSNVTPDVLDGSVQSITQIGSTVYAGGTFTQVRDRATGTVLERRSLVAFDAVTGRVSTSFAPTLDGGVNSLSTDGTSLFAGGYFGTVNGVVQRRVVKLTTAGALASGQPAIPNSGVNEVVVSGDRVYLGGSFTSVGGQARAALAAVDRTTGRLLADVAVPFTGTYNGGGTNIKRFDVSPDGRTLVAVGNFTFVGDQPHQQVALVDLPVGAPAAVSGWATDRFDLARNPCSKSFDTWTRDIDIAPDGAYFVITTTGAFAGGSGSGTLCDTASRWELGGAKAGQQPTWVDYTGGDTLYGVAITGAAVYIGGHLRWTNNPYQGDQAGPGAVSREGIAALDPVNGLPLSWNPGRARGVGAQALFATPQGLWVGSDTDRFAGELRQRVAFLPLAGGTAVPDPAAATLPNSLYAVQRTATTGRVLYRVNAGGPAQLSQDDGPDWAADTASSSPLRTSGSSSASTAIQSFDTTVPAGTPRALYETERWDGAGGDEMRWRFPVPSGKAVEVRVYLADTCSCTSLPGQRVFDVALEGSTWLSRLDLTGSVGHRVATMRSRTVTSDGSVDLDFLHVVQNPLVNAIEIIDASAPETTSAAALTRRGVDASGVPVSAAETVSTAEDWAGARGTFTVGKTLYYGTSRGLVARTFDDGAAGAPRDVDLHDDPDTGARIPFPTGNLTGAFYDRDTHRLYYTVSGDARLYYRGFTPESEVVGAQTFVGDNGGLDLSSVAGLTYAGGRVYYASATDGALRSVSFTGGALRGQPTTVSSDGSWASRGLFVSGPLPPAPNEQPTARASATCTELTCDVDAGASSDPDGSITSYAWDFGDGATASGATARHTYASGGTYTVTLTVTDDKGATATTTATASPAAPPANTAPTAAASATCQELVCTFDGTASADGDGTITAHAWDFGDGTTGTGATPQHTYTEAGDYTATLTVTDDDGATATTTTAVSPTAPPPNQAPRAAAAVTCSTLTCTFDAAGSSDPDGTITAYAWDFGDGTTGTGPTTQHTYPAAGDFTATLTVTDDKGATATTTATASPEAPPANTAPTAAASATCQELVCTFDGTASADGDGTITAHAWDFGDGTTGTGATPQHTYTEAGDYTATLTVTDDDGATATTTVTLTARSTPPPAAAPIGFRAAADGQGNSTAATVPLPSSIAAGDQLVVVLTTNRDATLTAPTGAGDWGPPVQQGTGAKGEIETTVYAKTADGTEAGQTLRIGFDAFSKYTVTATAHTGAVLESAALAPETSNRAAHTTPEATVSTDGSWVVSYWADKSSATTDWTSPAGTTDRAETLGAGAGRITSLLSDSNGPVAAGSHPGLTATADSASLKAITLTLVLRPTTNG